MTEGRQQDKETLVLSPDLDGPTVPRSQLYSAAGRSDPVCRSSDECGWTEQKGKHHILIPEWPLLKPTGVNRYHDVERSDVVGRHPLPR